MEKTSIIEELHRQALEALDVASDAIIDDTEADDCCPLLVMEAAYRIAVFSRAGRVADPSFGKTLRSLLHDTLKLMSGNGMVRLCEAAQRYFSCERIREQAEPLHKSVNTSIEKGELDRLLEEEEFEQAVFDLMLLFDRFYALCHPKDGPVRELRKSLLTRSFEIAEEYKYCTGLFKLFAEHIRRYARSMHIPSEKGYALWFPLPAPSTEQFIAAIDRALTATSQPREIFNALIKPLPVAMKKKLKALGIAERFGRLIKTLGSYARDVLEFLPSHAPVVQEPAPIGVYGERMSVPDSLALIHSQYHVSLKSLPALIHESPRLSPSEKHDLLVVAYLLLNDQKKLSALLKKPPQKL
ncbi:MAG: hypothetical protein N3B18_00735 [Desulfobacterota bacterium]|nr:hypothetical protein [Thermodesulfobacteriota bacterium]